MQSKVKLSKREIKEDKFTTFMLTSKQQLSDNWQFLVIGAVVVLLVIVGIVYMLNSAAAGKAEGARQFAQAMSEYRVGNRQVAQTTFQQFLEDHDGHLMAAKATFMLGQINFDQRNYTEAIRYWTMYLDKYKEEKLDRAGALAGTAGAYEEQGDYTQAAAKYLEAVAEFPEGPMVGYYRTGAMRAYLALNQADQAREQLDLIEKEFGETDLYTRAARLFAEKTAAAPAHL